MGTIDKKLSNFLTDFVCYYPIPSTLPLLNRHPLFFMIQRLDFVLILALLTHIPYILMCALFIIYLYYTYFILVYSTSLLYYTLIKKIYDPTSYFTLALYPSHYLHDSELFKISRLLVFLESTRLEFTVCNVHAHAYVHWKLSFVE